MRQKAFTLIELLVVVAIVGLLSSAILLNTRNTRLKAHDAQIQSYLHQVRNAAEMEYIRNNETYASVCDSGTLSDSGELGTLEQVIRNENGNQELSCVVSADGYEFAVSSPLRARPAKHWCVQSAGLSMEIDDPVSTPHCQ